MDDATSGLEHDGEGAGPDDVVRELGRMLAADVEAVAAEVAAHVVRAMPELGSADDERVAEETLDSGRANIGAMASMLAYGIPPGGIAAPHGAVEFARAMIRRGVELPVILRAYRVGHAALWAAWIRLCARELPDDARTLAAVVDRSSALLFDYIDTVCELLVAECDVERARWARTAAAARARTARTLLDGGPADAAEAGRTLRYDLGRHHVALIAWRAFAGQEEEASTERDLQRAVLALAARMDCPDPLLVPAGRGLLWAWAGHHVAVGREALDEMLAGPLPEGVHIAAGAQHDGIDGFRASHREAERVVGLLALAGDAPGHVVPYHSVALSCALCADPAEARAFVALELGGLAAAGEGAAALEATLRAYLDTGASHVRAARRLGVHEKTVTYRVRRAEALLGCRVSTRRVELGAALQVSRVLGLSPDESATPPALSARPVAGRTGPA